MGRQIGACHATFHLPRRQVGYRQSGQLRCADARDSSRITWTNEVVRSRGRMVRIPFSFALSLKLMANL